MKLLIVDYTITIHLPFSCTSALSERLSADVGVGTILQYEAAKLQSMPLNYLAAAVTCRLGFAA